MMGYNQHNLLANPPLLASSSTGKGSEADAELFRILVDRSPLGIYYLDLQGNCLFVNRRWLEITELSPNDALGKGWLAAIHPEDRDWLLNKFDSSDRPQELALEYRYCTPDNRVKWVFANLQLIGDARGISSLYVGTIADITHQKLTTTSIQERLSDLATASVGIALLDACGCYTYLNSAYGQIFGYDSADLLLGKTWETLYYSAEINWMKSQIFPWLQQHGTWQGQAIARRADGTSFNQDIALSVAADGQLIWVSQVTGLSPGQNYLAAIATNVRSLFSQDDIDREQIFYLTPAYAKIWGRKCENNYEVSPTFLEALHPEDRQQILANLNLDLEEKSQREYRIIQPDGNLRWLRDRAIPIRDRSGNIYRLICVNEDITEDKQTASEILAALDREKKISEMKSDFINTISHEFRTPLTSILGFSELLKHYCQEDNLAENLVYLQKIQDKVQHMAQMLDDVYTLGQAEAGDLNFAPELVNLRNFCYSLVEDFKQSLGKQHQLILELPEDLPLLCVDLKLIQHILSNLLSNAIKYSSTNSQVILTVKLADNPPVVTFQIRDSGIGIPAEEQQYLFDSFYRAKNVGKVSGTGLGLTIVAKAVDLHGGGIAVSSEVGKGTLFTVDIPVF